MSRNTLLVHKMSIHLLHNRTSLCYERQTMLYTRTFVFLRKQTAFVSFQKHVIFSLHTLLSVLYEAKLVSLALHTQGDDVCIYENNLFVYDTAKMNSRTGYS